MAISICPLSVSAVPMGIAAMCLLFLSLGWQGDRDCLFASGAEFREGHRAGHLYELTSDVAELLFLPHVKTFYANDVEALFHYARKVVEEGYRPENLLPRCSPELVKQEVRCQAHVNEEDAQLDYKYNLRPYRQGHFQISGSSADGLDLLAPDIGILFTVGTPSVIGVIDGKEKRYACKRGEDNAKKTGIATPGDSEVILKHTCRMFVDWTSAGSLEVHFTLKHRQVSVAVYYNGKGAAAKNVRVIVPFSFPEQLGFQTCLTLADEKNKGATTTPLCMTPEEMATRQLLNGTAAKRIRQVVLQGTKYFDVEASVKKVNAVRWRKDDDEKKKKESRQDVVEFEFSCPKKHGKICAAMDVAFTSDSKGLDADIRQEVRLLAGFTKRHPEGKKYTELVRSATVRLFQEKIPFRLQRCELLFAMAMVRPALSSLNTILSGLQEGQEVMQGWLCESNRVERDSALNKNRLFCHLCHMRGLARLISSLDPAVDDISVHRSVTQMLHRANEVLERHLMLVHRQKEEGHKVLAKLLRRAGLMIDETLKKGVGEVETYILNVFDPVAATLGALSGTCRWCRGPMTVNATVIALQVFAPHLTEFDEVYRRRWASEAEIVRNSFSPATNLLGSACLFPLEFRPRAPLASAAPQLASLSKAELANELSGLIGPYAKFMAQRMLHTVVLDGKEFSMFTETEKAMDGDVWMWTDDNAKSLEMLVIPGVYERLTSVANDIMNFCLEMMKTDFIIRRIAGKPADANMAHFKVEDFDASNFRLHNGLMNFKALPSVPGGVVQSYRFHDGRDKDVTRQLPPVVTVFFDGNSTVSETFRLEEQEGHMVNLSSPSSGVISVRLSGVLKRGTGEEFANFEYSFFMNSSRTATNHELKLIPHRGVVLGKVRVTFLTEFNPGYEASFHFKRLCSGTDGKTTCLPSLLDEERVFSSEPTNSQEGGTNKKATPPTWIAVTQTGNAGFSYASYTMVGSPEQYLHSAYHASESYGLTQFATHYECAGPLDHDNPCVLIETKLLTAGGLYDDMTRYDPLLTKIAKGEDQGMIDYSISYDIGAELNALASFYLFATTDSYSVKPSIDLKLVKSTIDRHLKVYSEVFGAMDVTGGFSNVFVRGLAFLIVTLTNMFAATGDNKYLEQLQGGIEMLSHSWLPGTGIFRCMATELWSSIDCHTSGLFAAARVLATVPLDLSHPVGNKLEEWMTDHGVQQAFEKANKKEGTPQFDLSSWTNDDFLWNFKCGITNRLISSESLARGKQYKQGELPEDLRRACLASLQASTVNYEDPEYSSRSATIAEIKTSPFSTETNSETQPWAVLGLHGEYVELLYTLTIREALEKNEKNIEANWYRKVEAPITSLLDEYRLEQSAEVCPSPSDAPVRTLQWYGRRRPSVLDTDLEKNVDSLFTKKPTANKASTAVELEGSRLSNSAFLLGGFLALLIAWCAFQGRRNRRRAKCNSRRE